MHQLKADVLLTPPPHPKIDVIATGIAGCFELRPRLIMDDRGFFAKVFHRPLWESLGLCTDFVEEYFTHSLPGTLRGMHFQLPPVHHHKVVLCLRGEALDVAIDLRQDSPTFGHHVAIRLNESLANALYLPAGLAHGFCVTGAEALLYYKVSTVYSPTHDAGIRWNSAGISWPTARPRLSERDRDLPPLNEFTSPFTMASSQVRETLR